MGFLRNSRWLRRCLLAVAAGSYLLIIHNYALNILPRFYLGIEPTSVQPDPAGSGFTYTFPFDASEPDGPYHARSRAILYENNVPQSFHVQASVARGAGRSNWTHEPDRIIFSAFDNSDPRTNGRDYYLSYPILYTHTIGRAAVLIFAASVAGLYWLRGTRMQGSPPTTVVPESSKMHPGGAGNALSPSPEGRWIWHLLGAASLFGAGLYLSTGTLSPYGDTAIPYVAPATGYLYNPDHPHFRALFDFVDGRDRSTWDGALFLRRILYNLLAYPAMKVWGWELGGTLTSLGLNLAAFVIFVRAVHRQIGTRAAVFSAWMLALYPGAAYWAGLPYQHALIVPVSLLLMLLLIAIAGRPTWRLVIGSALLLSIANLGYEFFIFFLPAALLVLAWRRRWSAIPVFAALQFAPLLAWAWILKHDFGQNLVNSNSTSFYVIIQAYFHAPDFARWRTLLMTAPDIGLDVFFGANFIFLPALFLAVIALNAVTSRIRPHPAEIALLAAGLVFFLFNNLAPDYEAPWQMRGTWIARLYQPVFPALLLFCARWYQHLPPLGRGMRAGIFSIIGLVAAGNALILFGPALMNPLRLSETAFYRFYDHANHANYELNLKTYGRRPLGFPRPARP